MNGECGARLMALNHRERGGARLKFLIVVALIAFVAHAGYQYVPVAVQAFQYKDVMQQSVDKAVALGKSGTWVGEQLRASASSYGVPVSAIIAPIQHDGRMEVRVQYTRPIKLPGYTYQYNFDHTAKSTEFLTSTK